MSILVKLAALLLLLLIIAAKVLAFETYAVKLEHVEIPIEGLPTAFDGLKIVLLADFHGRRIDTGGRAARAIADAAPDIVCLTGDYVHRQPEDLENIMPFLQGLTDSYPVYAVSGNHDQWVGWLSIDLRLQAAGITVLENRHVKIGRGNSEIVLAGAGDVITGQARLEEALPGNIDTTVILLVHSPTWFEPWHYTAGVSSSAAREGKELLSQVSLTLTGHTHGGQIKLPWLGAVTTASGRLFPKTHVQGLSREENGWLYISRGIGQGGLIAFRFLSRPEVTVMTLRTQ